MSLDTENRTEEAVENKKTVKRKKRRVKKEKKRPNKKRRIILAGILLAGLAIVAALCYFVLGIGKKEPEPVAEVQTEVIEEPVVEPEVVLPDIGPQVAEHIVIAGNEVVETYGERPEAFHLSEIDAANFGKIETCVIEGGSKVSVTMNAEGLVNSDDKFYYLFAINTYDSGIAEGSEPLDKVYKDSSITLKASLNYNSASSRLFKKFVVAVKKDDGYVQICQPHYITNPEAIARTSAYKQASSKKGLLVDPNKLRGNELDDLGVKQAAYNIPISRILGPTTHGAWPTIYYNYNGKTYTFNGQVIAEYDLVFGTLTAKGIQNTAILLNNYSGYTQVMHPNSRSGSTAPYGMFNAADESGVEYLAAVGTFLADRYSSSAHGIVSNWVIANEINARKEWNYMKHTDIETYVEEYAKAFRVFYTAIKSVNASARVYMPIDQQWDRNIKNNTNYDGRDIVDVFDRNITSKGDIDWGLAQHPYNVPLTEPRIWKATKYVKDSASTSMITMNNIEVLTNYMQQDYLLNPSGEVRSIILSEQGYTSTHGEALQAAAFAYAYYKVEANPHIDGFLLNRQTDAPEEVAQGLAFGLNHSGGGRKQLYNVFKFIDTPQHAEYTNFAKDIIGISSWSQIMD